MKLPILISYAYARGQERSTMWNRYVNHPHVELLLDSGAFTAKTTGKEIHLGDYCGFLDRWAEKLFGYLALDVVGDPKGTDTNLRQMVNHGYRPIPVHVLGDDEAKLDELFSLSDWVALAGLKRPGKGHCKPEYLKAKMQWAKGRRVHWLGYVIERMIAHYRPFSVDSSSWGSGFMYGTARYYVGNGAWARGATFNDRNQLLAPETIARLRCMGFTPDDFNNKEMWRAHRAIKRRSIPNALSVDSWVRYVLDVRRMYGTRIFLAVNTDEDDGNLILEALDGYKENDFRTA